MTKGIQVTWWEGRQVEEIEHFIGIDVDDLSRIPAFTSVPAYWPLEEGGTAIEYKVRATRKPGADGAVHLVVEYRREDNAELLSRYGYDELWGTNTIILVAGSRKGVCHWRKADGTFFDDIPWKAFDVAATNERPTAEYLRSPRHARFRGMVLARDCNRCVITAEATPQALDAAHLVPAKNGENDVPSNGIALRADLHRLFDAGFFTFDTDGKVVLADENPMSACYRGLLENTRMSPATLKRVRETLALPVFAQRNHAP